MGGSHEGSHRDLRNGIVLKIDDDIHRPPIDSRVFLLLSPLNRSGNEFVVCGATGKYIMYLEVNVRRELFRESFL